MALKKRWPPFNLWVSDHLWSTSLFQAAQLVEVSKKYHKKKDKCNCSTCNTCSDWVRVTPFSNTPVPSWHHPRWRSTQKMIVSTKVLRDMQWHWNIYPAENVADVSNSLNNFLLFCYFTVTSPQKICPQSNTFRLRDSQLKIELNRRRATSHVPTFSSFAFWLRLRLRRWWKCLRDSMHGRRKTLDFLICSSDSCQFRYINHKSDSSFSWTQKH